MGAVFDIQPYSVYDGPGIRTTVFLKGHPLGCALCRNPRSRRQRSEMGYSADRRTSCGRLGEYRDMGEPTGDMLNDYVNLICDFGLEAVINH